MNRPLRKTVTHLSYESFEPRNLLAADFLSGPVTIEGSSGNDVYSIEQLADSNLIEIRNNDELVRQFRAPQITSLQFEGSGGDDVLRFVNVTSLDLESLRLFGGAGNDFFLNENSSITADSLVIRGGAGDDVIDTGFVTGNRSFSDVFEGGVTVHGSWLRQP